MFEKPEYKCPECGYAIGVDLEGVETFTCSTCGGRFQVARDPKSGNVALFEDTGERMPEPLGMPKGSIRALVAIALAATSWVLMVTGRDVPDYLLGLLLAIIGYYFGFRTKVKAADSRIFDPAARPEQPLSLPGGFVRGVLTLGFLVAALGLYRRGALSTMKYAEFFVMLAGLVAGHFFGRTLARVGARELVVLANHAKGLAVLGAAAALALLSLSGADVPAALGLGLACVVSFYYGSRS